MNRLMRAEWYRVRHSSGFIKWLILFCVFCTLFPILADFEVCKGTVTDNLLAMEEGGFPLMFLMTFSAIVVGIAYMNKTAYYEVMAGNRIYQIVFSKVLVDAALITVAVFGFLGIYWTIIGVCNGIGEITQLPLRMMLLFIVFFHASSCGILMMTSFRQLIGAVLVFMRVECSALILLIVQELSQNLPEHAVVKLADWFTMVKTAKLLNYGCEVTNHLIVTVIIGMIIESAVWFAISYIGMKKRIYK